MLCCWVKSVLVTLDMRRWLGESYRMHMRYSMNKLKVAQTFMKLQNHFIIFYCATIINALIFIFDQKVTHLNFVAFALFAHQNLQFKLNTDSFSPS